MPEAPDPPPPVPDPLRGDRPAPAKPHIDILNDPFNPPPEPPRPAREQEPSEESEEENEKASSGLAEFDAPHAFASVLASGLGRVVVIVITCMLTFAFTAACHRVSLIIDGWRVGGLGGFFHAIFDVPASLFTGPGEWFTALGAGITDPVGVPYLLLFVGGIILAVRSEIQIVNLMVFYAFLGAIHAAAYLKMKHPVSIVLWLGLLIGHVWLYRWYWRQQIQVEEEEESSEE
jgi:hypothetical protein